MTKDISLRPIPVSAAEYIAKKYGYHQVVIIARKTGDKGGEFCTTFGINEKHCQVAASIGEFFKYKLMGWKPPQLASKEA